MFVLCVNRPFNYLGLTRLDIAQRHREPVPKKWELPSERHTILNQQSGR